MNLSSSTQPAQMERELQGRVLTLVEKASKTLEEESGVEPPMTEGEMKDYLYY
jgi:hypothetical protein